MFHLHRPTFPSRCGFGSFVSCTFWHVKESKRHYIGFRLESYIVHKKYCLLITFGYCQSISAEFICGPVYMRAVACELAISFAKYFVWVMWGRFASNICGVVAKSLNIAFCRTLNLVSLGIDILKFRKRYVQDICFLQ